jgi:demethylmenaquinone methyltransferase/2-methoxy-6-polyprenyl-1,4-benzoquinol methylase
MALSDLDPVAHLGDPSRKQRYVTTLFDTVAPRYDRFTRWFSFGMDRRWKRELAAWAAAALPPGGLLLDLACGTGDLARAVAVADGDGELIGLDPSREMQRIASARRPIGAPVRLVRADMMAIPLPAGSVDVVTVGYGFRNAPDPRGALAEAGRVLKPGGWLFALDFFKPASERWRHLYLWYLRRAGRLVGRWWHGEPEAYGYIARSIESWITPGEFRTALVAAGFAPERHAERLGGGICLDGARRVAC